MAKVGCVHHLDLVVSSLERSLPLYRELLAPLGLVEVHEVVGERGEPVFYLDGEGVGASLSLRQAQSPSREPYDRYAVGAPPPRVRGALSRRRRRAASVGTCAGPRDRE